MPANPTSLGDEPEKIYKLIQERYDLPAGGRKPLLAAIESILTSGGVQKLVIQYGQQIKVIRKVEAQDVAPDELVDNDIMDATRNAKMEELLPSDEDRANGISNHEYFFSAYHLAIRQEVEGRKVRPRTVIVKRIKLLENWLHYPKLDKGLYGMDIVEHAEMPEDSLLLVCADVLDEESILFSLKMEMDQPWRKKK